MFRSSGTPESARKREELPRGEETAVSGFKSRLVHWVATDASDRMRKYLYLVTEHDETERVGGCKIMDQQMSRPLKNEEGDITVLDREKGGFEQVGRMVGMGYADFEDEQDYEERIGDVIQEKLTEIDATHLEKAGVEQVIEA